MTLDIRGGLKNTKINGNPLVVVDELISNSIDSYLIRKNAEPSLSGLQVVLSAAVRSIDLIDSEFMFSLSCKDNGVGFDDPLVKAFVTKDTSFKDDLSISGINRCKGSGRIQFFHHYNKLGIDSVFNRNGALTRRTLSIDLSEDKEIHEGSFTQEPAAGSEIETTISLEEMRNDTWDRFFKGQNIPDLVSAVSLRRYVLITFLQRFVSLKDKLGDFKITFESTFKDGESTQTLTANDLPAVDQIYPIVATYDDGTAAGGSENLTIAHYKLDQNTYAVRKNTVALCAKSTLVKTITPRYLRMKSVENAPVSGFYHILLIEGPYLDVTVNEQRDDFDFPKESDKDALFKRYELSMEEIFDAVDPKVHELLTPPDWKKEDIVEDVQTKFGVSPSMIANAKVRVQYGDTPERVVRRVLTSYNDTIIQDTSEIFDIKAEIANLDPLSDAFRDKIQELSWKFTSSLATLDMANLSQLVVRRATMVETLDLAVNKRLSVQQNVAEKRTDEKIIHSVFFPMGKDSDQVDNHDIWLLNEEYHYFDYIASDMALSKIKWSDGSLLFSSDIDDELQKLLEKNYKDNALKRPDIAIFSKEGSLIIIEFKAPDVPLSDHVPDVMEYAQLLTAKSNGRIKKVYGYLIGDTLNPNRMLGYTKFPVGTAWFGTFDIKEHSTGTRLGELYSEVLYYEDIVKRANLRLDIYRKKLGYQRQFNEPS